MKKVTIAFLSTLALAVILTGCKKYEEGPALSFRTKFNRVVNTWQAKYVFRDAADATWLYRNWSLDLREDGRVLITNVDDNDSTVTQEGFWDLVNDKEDLRIIYTKPTQNPDRQDYHILKLKEEEFWFNNVTDTVTWEFRLIPAGADSTG